MLGADPARTVKVPEGLVCPHAGQMDQGFDGKDIVVDGSEAHREGTERAESHMVSPGGSHDEEIGDMESEVATEAAADEVHLAAAAKGRRFADNPEQQADVRVGKAG